MAPWPGGQAPFGLGRKRFAVCHHASDPVALAQAPSGMRSPSPTQRGRTPRQTPCPRLL